MLDGAELLYVALDSYGTGKEDVRAVRFRHQLNQGGNVGIGRTVKGTMTKEQFKLLLFYAGRGFPQRGVGCSRPVSRLSRNL